MANDALATTPASIARAVALSMAMFAAAATVGCAVPRQTGWTIDEALADAPLTCEGAQQCSEYWRRMQYWISTHSGFKIQLATDTVIETYNPPNYSLRWAFYAAKEPLGNGLERITIRASCGAAPICQEDRNSLIASAKSYVVGP